MGLFPYTKWCAYNWYRDWLLGYTLLISHCRGLDTAMIVIVLSVTVNSLYKSSILISFISLLSPSRLAVRLSSF